MVALVAGVRRRDRGAGHAERGLVQGLHADHAAAAGQPDAVDVGHAGRRRRAGRGRRQLTRRTHLFSSVFYKKTSNIRERRATAASRRL